VALRSLRNHKFYLAKTGRSWPKAKQVEHAELKADLKAFKKAANTPQSTTFLISSSCCRLMLLTTLSALQPVLLVLPASHITT